MQAWASLWLRFPFWFTCQSGVHFGTWKKPTKDPSSVVAERGGWVAATKLYDREYKQ